MLSFGRRTLRDSIPFNQPLESQKFTGLQSDKANHLIQSGKHINYRNSESQQRSAANNKGQDKQTVNLINKNESGWPTLIQGVHNIEFKKGKSQVNKIATKVPLNRYVQQMTNYKRNDTAEVYKATTF